MSTTRSRRSPEEAGGARFTHSSSSAVPRGDDPAEAPEVLVGDARRRQQWRWAFCALAIASAVGLSAVLAASFSRPPKKPPPKKPPPKSHRRRSRRRRATAEEPPPLGSRRRPPAHRPVCPRVTRTAAGLLSWHGPMHSPRVFDTSPDLYFAWSTTLLGAGMPRSRGPDHAAGAPVLDASGGTHARRSGLGEPRDRHNRLGAGRAAADIATGAHYLERIDPWMGAVELRAAPRVRTATVGGVIRTAPWIGVRFGTMGNALRASVSSLQPVGLGATQGSARRRASRARAPTRTSSVEGGHLYVTAPNAPTRNYCAVWTGQAAVPLRVDLRHDDVLALSGTSTLIFQVTTSTRRTPTSSEASVPVSRRSNG